MRRVAYENEPFDVTRDESAQLRELLGGRFREERHQGRIVGVCGQFALRGAGCMVVRSRKSETASLLAWLAHADPTLGGLRLLGRIPNTADDTGFGHLVARAFCVETWRAIQGTGLIRNYHRQEVRSAVVRGRIDFDRMAKLGGDLGKTPCIVFARLPRTPLNRLLATAVEMLRYDPELRAAAGTLLAPLRSLLAEVPVGIDVAELKRPTPGSRAEQPFEAAAALGRLIVRRGGLSQGGSLTSLGLLVDVAALFEATVARAFRDSNLDVSVKHPLRIPRQAGTAPADRHVSMEIDVLVRPSRQGPIVVDAKYKTEVSSGNLQQMVAYCWLTGARRAALVFPAGVLGDQRSFVLPAPGGERIDIHLHELDLSGRTPGEWREAGRALVGSVTAGAMSLPVNA